MTMGTSWSIKAVPGQDSSKEESSNAIQKAVAAIEHVDASMSTYKSTSGLSRFNATADAGAFTLSPETFAVFQKAGQVCETTGGAFDITVGPLVNAWGFGPDHRPEIWPSEEELAALRERVGFDKLVLDASACAVGKARPDVYCDLSAIAKGFAVDQAAGVLDAAGVPNYMIEVGGEVRTRGVNQSGQPWRIAIQKPDSKVGDGQMVVPLSGLSMATSGDYRNYYEVDGKRLSHTIDPRTGHPIGHNLASASVIHEECAMADAYATALMVLGPEEGMALAERLKLPVVLLVREQAGTFEVRESPAYTAYMAEAQKGEE
jgi:FAD:protein FMN transferase